MKRLIYPLVYYTDEFNNKLVGMFSGMDVRTGEEIFVNTRQEPTDDLEIPEFFKENDVLFMEFGKSGKFSIARVANRKQTYEEVQRAYLRFKEKELSEEEINNEMINKYNFKPVKTKRMYKK